MKIIHCADIHLDSGMESHLSGERARERQNEICHTFARMVSFARERDVRVILIAGDLFDTQRKKASTVDFVLSQIRKAPGIDFLYLCGNHDRGRDDFAGRPVPENLKTFSTDWTYYDYGPVRIAGAELCRENCETLYARLELAAGPKNIVMLHGQVATRCGEDLVCLPRLRGKHIDYLALGHLHSYRKERLDLEGEYCYCGCLEGRGFDECGDKGFVLLDVDGGRLESRFVPFARRRLHHVPLDISGLCTVSEIEAALRAACADIPEEDLVKVTLTGGYDFETQKDTGFLEKLLEGRFYALKVKDESRLNIDRGAYENDISLKGAFIRTVMASDRSEEEKEKMICWGIQALSGKEIVV